ncbi:DUF3150 domain-containing protein [Burkholderia cenocepacia]|uniref:DUF3150 domain-containing protein n=1 Tax=Burkholderia cenocepacia TaxID=95486 RepID=UPI0007615E07|nr:DUF3150 domain-containing protein [Burkholderia cenocepacia]KWU24733.1 hypothetical protein AS149_31810 [Burkholderia cenocepacia]
MENKTEIKNAVLVMLSIREWQAKAQDKTAAAQVAKENDVQDSKRARVWKDLLTRCDAVKKYESVRRAARTYHYQNTLTWMHDGPRILTTANYDEYMTQMRQFRAQFDAAVLDFIEQYPQLKHDSKVALGRLYDESQYLSHAELMERYSFSWQVMPMPATEGLLSLNLKTDDAEQLADQLREEMNESFRNATRKMWADLFEVVEKLVLKLKDESSKVKATHIDSVRELTALLPRLNIMGDEHLDIIAKRLNDTLQSVTESKLELDISARRKVAEETQSVFNVIQTLNNTRQRAVATPRPAQGGSMEMKRAA